MLINFHLTSKESRAQSNLFSNSISAAHSFAYSYPTIIAIMPGAVRARAHVVRGYDIIRAALHAVVLDVRSLRLWRERVL